MSDDWYYIDTQGVQQGPVTVAVFAQHFQTGKCNEQSACWNSTLPDWAVIASVNDLLSKLKPAAVRPAVAPRPAAAAPPAAAPAPAAASEWQTLRDDTGREYYYNSRSGQSSWDKPAELNKASSVASAISSMAAQRPQKLQMEKLGAPEPVSSGVAQTGALQIVRRAEPEHGWKALKSADGQEYYFNSKTNVTQWEKPDELKTADDYERAGEWYWVPHDQHGYAAAKKANTSAGKTNFETETGERLSFTDKQVKELEPMKWLQLRQLQADLVMLDVMNKPLILYNLKKRFEQNEIYTSIGTILISINPYKRLPLYTPAVMEEYIRRGNRKLAPHVFLIADDAFKALLENRVGQSIVISGESGAGKTECTKQALQYLAEIAGSATSNVQERILASNPILEAFGNAKTVRNNNSSRFGKYVEIYFDARAQICGSTNTNYLLEKIRVVKQSPGERNYHAFYQLLRGATSQQKQQFQLREVSSYWYLAQSGCDTVDDVDDVAEHEDVVQAMRELGWSQDEMNQVYQTVSGVLHLGNIKFRSSGDRKSEVTTPDVVKSVCSLLQIDSSAFLKAVTTRMMRIQGQADIEVGLSKEEADAARDALAKFIYEKMFDWIVVRINQAIGRGNAQSETIGILDIFGFEIFEHNQFEQLCINFTNEKLQQFFNQHTFKKEEELYRFEGINFAHVNYIDNQPVLDLIEMRPRGILPCVDEEIRMPKGSDKTFLQKLQNNHQGSKYYKPYLKNPDMFVVEHYAGTVVYDSNGFLEKNRDQLNDDAISVLTSSTFKFLARLFEERDGNKKATLGSKFAKQLNDLMTALNATEPHYIRCVKPNANKAPMQMQGQMSLEQLQYAGVFEAVTIRKQGFPFRLSHLEFFKRYKCLFKDKHWDTRVIENCKFLIQSMGQSLNEVQIGTSRVLYRAEQHRNMELKRNLAVEDVTIYAQKYCRRVLTKLLRQRCTKFKPILKAAIDSRSIEKVDEAIAQAAGLGFPIYELKQAQRMKFVFQEEKRLEQLFTVLVHQDPQENFDAFQAAVESADDIELKSPASNQVRQVYYAAKAIRDAVTADAEKQEKVLDEVQMKAIMERADALPSFYSEPVERLRQLLYNTSEDVFVKMQLKAAVQLRDPELVQAREIRLKDLFLDKAGPSFAFNNFTLLYPSIAWSDLKVISFSRDELAAGMLKWTDSAIHAPLTSVIDPLNKELYNTSKRLFKNVLGFMGDKKQQQPVMLAVELITEALKTVVLRDEMYCQIMKQLTNNPNPESKKKGWDLMICLLHAFPPSTTLDNYLQMFFRTAAQPPRKFINLMHKTMYQGAMTNYPTENDINSWINSQESLDCDDYKTKIAKAEARLKEAQKAGTAPAPIEKRNGYGFGWGSNPSSPNPASPGMGSPGMGGGPGMGQYGAGAPMGGAPGMGRPPGAPAPAPAPRPAAPAAAAGPAGPPDHLQWHVIDASEAQIGPLTKQQLRDMFKSQKVTANSYCWNDAMAGWETLGSQSTLIEYLQY